LEVLDNRVVSFFGSSDVVIASVKLASLE